MQYYEYYRDKDRKYITHFIMFFNVLISESLEALDKVRPRWPKLDIDDEEPESTGVEDQRENEPANNCIQNNKDQAVSIYPFHTLFVKFFMLM